MIPDSSLNFSPKLYTITLTYLSLILYLSSDFSFAFSSLLLPFSRPRLPSFQITRCNLKILFAINLFTLLSCLKTHAFFTLTFIFSLLKIFTSFLLFLITLADILTLFISPIPKIAIFFIIIAKFQINHTNYIAITFIIAN